MIVSRVLEVLVEVYARHRECRYAVLNDPAVVLYGLVKPVEEVRVIADHSCAENLLHTVLAAFNVEEQYVEALSRLREQGLVAVSTRFYPLLVFEVARSQIDLLLVENTIDVELDGIVLRIPRLEYLIAKLIHMNVYPYTEYAYALLIPWIKRLDVEVLLHLLRVAGVDINRVVRRLEDMYWLSTPFPNLLEELKLALSLVGRVRGQSSGTGM